MLKNVCVSRMCALGFRVRMHMLLCVSTRGGDLEGVCGGQKAFFVLGFSSVLFEIGSPVNECYIWYGAAVKFW